MQVAIYCVTAEQAALVELFFPVQAGDSVVDIVHMPCADDVAQYCVLISLHRPAMSLQQRASLTGWCSWYAYRGDPSRLLGSIDLDCPETFASWLAFQEDSIEKTWGTVLQDYACALAVSEKCSLEWLYGQKKAAARYRETLPVWFFALLEFITREQMSGRILTKVALQQLMEQIGDRRDLREYQNSI